MTPPKLTARFLKGVKVGDLALVLLAVILFPEVVGCRVEKRSGAGGARGKREARDLRGAGPVRVGHVWALQIGPRRLVPGGGLVGAAVPTRAG